jgi:RHS repeat-associated protein
VRTLTDITGTVTDTYDYDAWGNIISQTGTTPNVYLYRGEQYDPDLRLYYLRARYFNQLSGRFLTVAPELGAIAKPLSLHKYVYAESDPITKQDPTGHPTTVEYSENEGSSGSRWFQFRAPPLPKPLPPLWTSLTQEDPCWAATVAYATVRYGFAALTGAELLNTYLACRAAHFAMFN